jgi:hypothetical protein
VVSIALAVAMLGTVPSSAAPLTTKPHPWTSVTLSSSHVEQHTQVVVTFCWHNAPRNWIALLSTGDNPGSALDTLYAKRIYKHNACVAKKVSSGLRGIHPFSGQLLTPHGTVYVTAAQLLFIYAATSGATFVSSILYPHCNGKGTVVIAGSSYAFTCSMSAITSHLTKTPTSCRSATFMLASTDNVNGDPSSKGKSVFEIAQNVLLPFFARFHDNVVTRTTLQLYGSAFWVAYKSDHTTSRLYFLDQGATADCYTSTGKA